MAPGAVFMRGCHMIFEDDLIAKDAKIGEEARSDGASGPNESDLRSIAMAVFWLVCLAVGMLGLWMPYPHPQAKSSAIESKMVNVEVVKEIRPHRPKFKT